MPTASPPGVHRGTPAGTAAPAYRKPKAPDRGPDGDGVPTERRREPRADRWPKNSADAPIAIDAAVDIATGETGRERRRRLDLRAVGWVMRLADAVVVSAAGAAAYFVPPGIHRLPGPLAILIGLGILIIALRSSGADTRLVRETIRHPRSLAGESALRTLMPFMLALAVVVALPVSGGTTQIWLIRWLGLWATGAAVGIFAVRLIAARLVAHWHWQGRLKQAVAIFGTGDLAERLLERLNATCAEWIELIGVFDDRRRPGNSRLRALVRGTAADLIELSRQRMIDRVIVALPHSAEERVLEVLHKLHKMPVEISLAPDMVGFSVASRDSAEFDGLPLIDVYGRPLSFGQNLAKSAFDSVVATLALIAAAPVMLVLAIAIRLDSKGPVLFRQNRLGFGDRVIRVYKFRTMRADAPDQDGERQSSPDDPRITRVGRFLRKSSLDELPQLLNVLKGEMSLVGPRPHAVAMQVDHQRNEDIVPDYALRHHVKPGITGWAQVNGYHGPVNTKEALRARVAHDLDYINNWSLWFDIRSLILTIKVLFGRRDGF